LLASVELYLFDWFEVLNFNRKSAKESYIRTSKDKYEEQVE